MSSPGGWNLPAKMQQHSPLHMKIYHQQQHSRNDSITKKASKSSSFKRDSQVAENADIMHTRAINVKAAKG